MDGGGRLNPGREVQNILALFSIKPEAAQAKLETEVAQLERKLAELDAQRQPLQDLLEGAKRSLDMLLGRPLMVEPAPVRRAAPAAPRKPSAAPVAGEAVTDWAPATIEPRQKLGLFPQGVRVSEFASETLVRQRLAEFKRIGFAHSTRRPLRPGQFDFFFGKGAYYLVVSPMVAAGEAK